MAESNSSLEMLLVVRVGGVGLGRRPLLEGRQRGVGDGLGVKWTSV